MPVTYHYEPDQVVVFTYVDPVTFDEWRAAIQAALTDAAYSPDVRVLSDRRQSPAPDAAFIRHVAATIQANPELFTQHPVAILVATADAAAFGMGRMQEMLVEGPAGQMRTFYDYSDALEWLKAQPSGPHGTAYAGPFRRV